jgi:hypothetical protein
MNSGFAKLALFALIAIVASGCAAKGPKFEPTSEIPEGKSLVYIYRPGGFVGSGVHYDVYAGETKICNLVQGSYCKHLATPGELELWGKTESKGSVTLDIKGNDTYYVKGGVSMGMFVGRPHLTVVDRSVGEKEITETKLSID